MKSLYLLKLTIFLAILSGFGLNAFAQTSTFTFNGTTGSGSAGISGTPQAYNVPTGVTQIAVDMYGGAGGWPCCSWTSGGPISLGGRVQCTMNVTPMSTLYIYVGGSGGSSIGNDGTQKLGGWPNGGIGGAVGDAFCGSGGGESDIRTSTTGAYASSVLVVAGAGGGGGDFGPVGGAGGGTTGGTGASGICGGGQTGPSCTTGSALGTQGQGGSCTCYSDGGGGGGWWGGNCGTSDQAGGGGSSYPATPNSVVTAIVHTQGYSLATGNGQVTITVLCQSPGTIVGSTPVCPGATITLTNPTAGGGGTWISGNPAVATINSSTGVVTGVMAGTTTITYSETNPCGGPSALATAIVTVNPLPGPITGSPQVCTGFTTSLSDGGLGTWTSSNTSAATVSSSGVVSGLTAGLTTISYTLATGCAPATTVVTVNTFPAAISGTLSVCASGATTTLTDALSGGTWTSSAPGFATIGIGSGVVTGVSAGTTNITYTAPTGCVTSSVVTVNPLPGAIAGITNVCAGSTATLSDPTSGGTWTSNNTSQATIGIGTGLVTGIVAGTPTITYTLATTGCSITTPLVVSALPGPISGGSNLCVGATTPLTDAGTGTWASSNTSVASINAFTGSVTGVAPGTTSITYTLATGCSVSSSVLVNPVPTAYTLTGGGSYCSGAGGVHVGLSYSSSGVNYVLYNGITPVSVPVAGSNSGLDFGLQTGSGTYTVVATNTLTGCVGNMAGSVTVTVNPLPGLHNITGGGGYCTGTTGSPLGTDGSDAGIHYQLYNGSVAVGPVVAGTGSALSFGNYTATGTYTVLATNPVTGCSQWQGSSAVISVTPGPNVYGVTGGGSYCAGGTGVHIYLSNSDAGTSYQLVYGGVPGSPVFSTGGSLDFGPTTGAGTYTVVAINPSGCPGNMSGSATVIINPLPAVNAVTGGGGYCAGGSGVHIGLSFSTPGVNYELIYSGGSVATVGGSGSGLDFGAQTVGGTYTVIAVNPTTGCTNNMSGSALVTINPLPNSFDVLGSGSFCAGGGGRDITTDGSQTGVNYQLYEGSTAVGTAIAGTGSGLNFGPHASTGSYTVIGTNSITGCRTIGTGSAVITINPLPILHTVTGGGNYCSGGAGADVSLSGSNTGIVYQLMLSGGGIAGTMSGSGGALDFGLQAAAGVYTVEATDSVTGCQKTMTGSATVGINPLPAVYTVTGGGSYCAGGAGFAIGLSGSGAGISYQLSNGGTPSGAPTTGSGLSVNFGVKTAAGVYTVAATNTLTGCSSAMSGSATINVNSLPVAESLGGGGNYCVGGPGVDVNLSGSLLGVNYQLFSGGVGVGAVMAGVGGPLDFGMNTAGVYTAVATDTTTGCMANMPGSITVNAVSPVVYTVTGGGGYCAGGTGVVVGQTGSAPGVSYQLYDGTSPVGGPMSGTGATLNFGLLTAAGVYTVEATDTTLGCMGNMAGGATVVINSLPAAETVTGGGSFCAGAAGAPVGLAGSVSGVNYQLYNGGTGVGLPLSGSSGSSLDFGLETTAGTYTVRAINAVTGCISNMTGSATISVLPTPAQYLLTVDNSGNYCAADSGLHIWLAGSQAGDNYELFLGSTASGTVIGTGAMLDLGLQTIAGTYTVVASNPSTMCTSNMLNSVAVNIVPLPSVHNVTGGGGFCSGGTGVPVGLDGSDAGVYYQLYDVSTLAGASYGTGMALDFGLQSAPGNYTVVGNSEVTDCRNNMLGSANVYYDTLPAPDVTIRSYPATGVGVWQVDSVKALVTNGGANPMYQWYVNGNAISGATNALFTNYQLFNNDVVSCEVTVSGPCGSAKAASNSLTITLSDVGVSQVSTGGDGVRLVPNPNRGVFTVIGTIGIGNEKVAMEVTNMLGQLIYKGNANTANGAINERIDLGNSLANGMYLLNLSSGGQHTVFHFVIEQ